MKTVYCTTGKPQHESQSPREVLQSSLAFQLLDSLSLLSQELCPQTLLDPV